VIDLDLPDEDIPDVMPPETQPKYKGRKPGTANRHSSHAVRRLKELGFDPIEKMTILYKDVDNELMALMTKRSQDGRVNMMAFAQLLGIQQKLVNDLMRYGYARVSETIQIEQKATPNFVINLTTPETFKMIDGVNVIENDEENDEDED